MRLVGIKSYVPTARVSLEELGARHAIPDAQMRAFGRYHRLRSVAMAEGESLGEFLSRPIDPLLASTGVDRASVRYVLYCHTALSNIPASRSTLAEVTAAAGLDGATSLSLTMGHCATGIVALQLARSLLAREEPGAHVLILTGEKCFDPTIQVVYGSGLMGEASAAVLVGGDAGRDEVLAVAKTSLGKYAIGPQKLGRELLMAYDSDYPVHFNATARRALAAADVAASDVALLLPHNVNMVAYRKSAAVLGIAQDRLYLDTIADLGHCFCSDVFVNYSAAVADGRLRPGDIYLMTGAGLGATFATAVLRH